VIVFTESRDTAETLAEFLGNHFETARFVGQSDTDGSDGMSQREQQETLDSFRSGEFQVLVSTSVAEEGLDVPEVDLVLFYEPVPTAIRAIQRKGRTGRQSEGRVVVLLAEGTRDEAYYWKAKQDEKKMKRELRTLKDAAGDIESRIHQQVGLDEVPANAAHDPRSTTDGASTADSDSPVNSNTGDSGGASKTATDGSGADEQAGLDAFARSSTEQSDHKRAASADSDEKTDQNESVVAEAGTDEGVELVIDQRELDSTIARDLSTRDGLETRLETLAVGDYVCSDRVVVERKTVDDFLDTLTGGDRSMFEQVGDAARHYSRPLVIVEGEGLYSTRNIHPKAIHGALASLAVDFGVSIMQTADESETADLLATLAEREQEDSNREVSVHGEKQSKTLAEQQEYVVASIAEVGPVTARALLAELGSVEAVMTADRDALLEADGVGPVTADRIREVVSSSYGGETN